eukprot:CAMPEP_0113316530 /NCGR_PEP_ID=MMETSP0010_2-20120614/11772_1 /TAXON_ID=216773 ORGANISM="Corethron hystrix, Strain 308" /NCGR_SAMPLE_ID=MMETSP0010_2 /ASSEMBLY_ACC=CAM_ASM_000155 /LENGTH=329 /DNA_ID=CAMNT_0000173271 /DNA_START=49 /DNA_END=1038 /DNA_ORIENTATION=+ /assembly_acc=CAM_ASM_000155
MSDSDELQLQCAEEQEMEEMALASIFGHRDFNSKLNPPCKEWTIVILPYPSPPDESESDGDASDDHVDYNVGRSPDSDGDYNHVGLLLTLSIPPLYPLDKEAAPSVKFGKPLISLPHPVCTDLMTHIKDTLLPGLKESMAGMPYMYDLSEGIREWLLERNDPSIVRDLGDGSMYGEMIRRKLEQDREKEKMQREYESQKTEDTMTQAEIEEMEVRKRRAEGTPCTDETFEKWANSFNAEKETEDESRNNNATTEKLNGRELFLQGLAKGRGIGKSAAGLEAAVASAGSVKKNAVAAAENADEDLFDDGDSDLDDLDFDDDFDDDDSTNS